MHLILANFSALYHPSAHIQTLKCEILTNNYPIGKYEKLNIGCKSAKHKPSGDHDPAEDGYGSGPEVHNTGTADGTCAKGQKHHLIREWETQNRKTINNCSEKSDLTSADFD